RPGVGAAAPTGAPAGPRSVPGRTGSYPPPYDRAWIRRATSSLPVPVSPRSSTALSCGANGGEPTVALPEVGAIRVERRALRFHDGAPPGGAGLCPIPRVRVLTRDGAAHRLEQRSSGEI